jgi:dTDP-4-amino-4,6-dideoxygalactose transaminase
VVHNRGVEQPAAELAILGGTPAFAEKLHVGRPNIGDRARFLQRINEMLDRRWFSNNGEFVQQFERRIEEYLGVKHCIVMCNATVALEIASRALDFTGEVIVPSFTFVATPHALRWQGIIPIFCDVDPKTHNLDPAKLESLITPKTTGILGVHVWGQGCDVDAIQAVADRHGLQVLYDAAHAFGCTHGGKMIGGFGRAEVFSFHATKFLNTFEGGAVTTNDDDLARKIRLMKNFGFEGYDNVVYLGVNGKMNEASAAMGLTSLESIDHFIDVNRRNHAAYSRELGEIPGVSVLQYKATEKNNSQYVVVSVDPDICPLSRDQLVKVLWAENVMARRYFYPGCHQMEPYRTEMPDAEKHLPETRKLSQRVMILPSGTAVDEDTIARVCEIVQIALARPEMVRNSIGARSNPV